MAKPARTALTETPALPDISARAFMDEKEAVGALLEQVEHIGGLEKDIMENARAWASAIRKGGIGHGMEAFLHTYGLNTKEGVALMCLAEALLRIPDSKTADRLIKDTFEGKDWRGHAKDSDSWLISASSWGLLFTGKVVDFEGTSGVTGTLRSLVGKAGEPVIREALKKAMRIIGSQFVLGETIEEGLENSKPWIKQGFRFSYDILGEGARSDAQAQHYVRSYHAAITLIGASDPHPNPLPKRERGYGDDLTSPSPSQGEGRGEGASSLFSRPSISVKLSALHPRYALSKETRVLTELKSRLKEILLLAKTHNITVSIDAEEANRLDIELLLFADIIADPAFAGYNGIGFVVQAYQKRAFYVIDYVRELARLHGKIIPLRLVKGAYWDSEIKQAQVMGLPGYPVFTRKEHTDVSYLACADKMLQAADCFYPQFATHNARTIASIEAMAKKYGVKKEAFEFQRLHGMGEKLHEMVIEKYPSRIYAPIGAHRDLLAYLIRRLLENGANTSFVNLLMDKETTLEELLADPVAKTKNFSAGNIPLPHEIYGDRKNSGGMDLGYLALRDKWLADMLPHKGIKDKMTIAALSKEEILGKIEKAQAAFGAWAMRSVEERAGIIEKAGDLMEKRRGELMALLIEEGGKTIPDAVAEVREAADFCRYYALQARKLMAPETLTGPTGESNQLFLYPRGVFGCISPWNFPLAIFTGQVVAALVTGNCALAKPAEQTPRIAQLAVNILHEAGVPVDVLQLTPARGSVIGQTVVADARVAGIVFTGSVEVAQTINKTLAARPGALVPFIAETGGQNSMVVDSSALLEAAVDDIILSAFGSAGQRCSALRVLYVQDDIAEELLTLLKGAMAELSVGDSSLVATDVGPVIDSAAQKELLAHIDEMKKSAKLVAAAPASGVAGSFVPPHAFEIKHISELTKENFGPVLHIIRFGNKELARVAGEINATGFGLTFGLHSRIEEHVDFFTRSIRAGNIYVNRSMIGAVVGVQPFGGEGLSGTGPKAGGPLYLTKFLTERTVSNNTAAIGGNVALLALE